jgi:hypothetical protein
MWDYWDHGRENCGDVMNTVTKIYYHKVREID